MNSLSIWLLFIVLAAGTFALRFSFIYLFGKVDMPDWLRRALRFVPASVLAALVFPALIYPNGTLDLTFGNIRLLAGIGRGHRGHERGPVTGRSIPHQGLVHPR